MTTHDNVPRWRTAVTRWGWLAILVAAALSLLLVPSDGLLLGSRVFLALGLLAAGVGVALKRRPSASK